MKYTLIFVVVITTVFSGCAIRKNEENVKKQEIKTEKETLLSEAQTDLYDKSESRINNIRLSASALDGYRIASGDVFSFNNAVGERTEEKGYQKAPVIIHEEKEYDYGGGVCQLSTTLFQAAKSAGLEITERHIHEKEIDYAKAGEDAAVSFGSLDLKFINNTDNEIVIKTGVYDDFLVVQLYSSVTD